MVTTFDRDVITLSRLDVVMDHNTGRIDRHRIEYALRIIMEKALANERLELTHWAGACVRVAMKRHDVEHKVMPASYELFDPARLMQQFREHPVAKEYGYGEETQPGAT